MEKKKLTYLILGIAAVVLVVASIFLWFFVFALPAPEPEVQEEDVIATESDLAALEDANPSLIDGEDIDVGEEKMVGVIIENHSDSRRQMSGLGDASLVFETEAEGGITRFLALYPYQNTAKVGPVRSARPYFVRWAEQFNTAFAHAGGSDMGLSAIYNSGNIFDLDGLALEGGISYFTRDYRYYAPHNLFANLAELRELMDDRGWDKPIKEAFVEFGKADDPAPGEEVEEADIIHVYYPFPEYFVRFDYDSDIDAYKRYQAGAPHIDHGTETQITTSNVVVMITNYYPTDEEGRLYMKTDGTGDMYLFRNGKVYPGTWSKLNQMDSLKFYDENDRELKFEQGKTWISVVNLQSGIQWE